jgi:hypothetical protein
MSPRFERVIVMRAHVWRSTSLSMSVWIGVWKEGEVASVGRAIGVEK